ncbi:Fumarylacetoacetate hydrolase domain-containing protein 2-like protein [Colletotrichum siamense]|uniref:Fumarylacetoacetate hydrolase domain-containing protein 2-like protein n=1 Tax=Colletotrichum siamense TaxID=690259 RepID=A0A9P5K276_COLSI|nr:Fumarylacetoacetate hydrolase domain-containing protein 2-like protein [Colletotrichum siamense]KAF4856451.1 Fumarylacetoacetate hydrolase domain-containing protein 2-like protein [Colletotrichum siamense]
MSSFSHLVRFESEEDGAVYFADLGPDADGPPSPGAKLSGAKTIEALAQKSEEDIVTVRRLLPPLPQDGLPIYCVGLNYRSHAKEAGLDIPACPPLWTKPAAALVSPGEEIPVNDFCAKSLLDYEGELVFVTSKDAKNVSVSEAKNYILGYTIGNDLSCRMYQLPRYSAGVNGDVRQTTEFSKDLIFSPEKILSHMSQGTTIPAGTAVMTGTPAGVGAFRQPKSFLQDGDVVEVEMKKVGVLRNKIKFE